jgi:hypothetical protein
VKIALAAALLVVSAIPCHAEAKAGSGNDLLESCEIQMQAAAPASLLAASRSSYCLGFVTAILSVGESLPQDGRFCVPPQATVGQAVAVFVKFMKANPELTHVTASALASVAFQRAWPCK